MLNENHIKQLEKESGISPETLEKSGVTSVSGSNAGISFEYLDVESGNSFGTRTKLDKPSENVKYLSKEGAEPGIYFHPKDLEDLQEPSIPLIIAEGEKKALKGHQELKGYVVTGIPGCWGFSHKKELSPQWQLVPLEGREVIVCPDTDFKTNPKVSAAMNALLVHLRRHGAKVKLIDLSIKGVKEKIGLDDYLMKEGKNKFLDMLDQPMWEFGQLEAREFPRIPTEKNMVPLFKKLVLESPLELDAAVTMISNLTPYGKRTIRAAIREQKDKWKKLLSVKEEDRRQVFWDKTTKSTPEAIRDLVKEIEKDDDLFIHGIDKVLATIDNGELLRFDEASKLATYLVPDRKCTAAFVCKA